MMESRLIFWIALCVLAWNVQTADTCVTHENCKTNLLSKFCCGSGEFLNRTKRTCQITGCKGKYCATESHCGESTLCCLSNECVDRGCSGCASNSDCSSGYVCCKKSFPKDQTVCAKNCVDLECNNNDDCAGSGECCRGNKCVPFISCTVNCKANSECDSGNYCCKKEPVLVFFKGECRATCIGIDCNSDDDCGPPNEGCVAGKCATEESSAGKESSPPWRIVVIVIAGLIALGVSIAVYWNYKRKRPSNATQVNRASLPNTPNHEMVITNQKPNTKFTGFNNPTQQQGTAFALHPGTDRYRGQQDTLDNDGYVISPDDPTYEYPEIVPVTQRQADPQFHPPNALSPPPYPGNHP